MITGFRVGLHGAQHFYQIEPDLTCFGKVIGGGFPAAAVGGKAHIMDHLAPLGQGFTKLAPFLSRKPHSYEGGLGDGFCLVEEPGFYEELLSKTNRLLSPIRKTIENFDAPVCIQQVGSDVYSLLRLQASDE